MKSMNGRVLAFEEGRDEMMPKKMARSVARACEAFFRQRGMPSRHWRGEGFVAANAAAAEAENDDGTAPRRDGAELLDGGADFAQGSDPAREEEA